MRAKLTVNMDNAAFDDGEAEELARILRDLADRIDGQILEPGDSFHARDANGNVVGGLIIETWRDD